MASYWKALVELQTSTKASRKRPREGNARMESINSCRSEMRSRKLGERFIEKETPKEKDIITREQKKEDSAQQSKQ